MPILRHNSLRSVVLAESKVRSSTSETLAGSAGKGPWRPRKHHRRSTHMDRMICNVPLLSHEVGAHTFWPLFPHEDSNTPMRMHETAHVLLAILTVSS